jgi:hypothetical protein
MTLLVNERMPQVKRLQRPCTSKWYRRKADKAAPYEEQGDRQTARNPARLVLNLTPRAAKGGWLDSSLHSIRLLKLVEVSFVSRILAGPHGFGTLGPWCRLRFALGSVLLEVPTWAAARAPSSCRNQVGSHPHQAKDCLLTLMIPADNTSDYFSIDATEIDASAEMIRILSFGYAFILNVIHVARDACCCLETTDDSQAKVVASGSYQNQVSAASWFLGVAIVERTWMRRCC